MGKEARRNTNISRARSMIATLTKELREAGVIAQGSSVEFFTTDDLLETTQKNHHKNMVFFPEYPDTGKIKRVPTQFIRFETSRLQRQRYSTIQTSYETFHSIVILDEGESSDKYANSRIMERELGFAFHIIEATPCIICLNTGCKVCKNLNKEKELTEALEVEQALVKAEQELRERLEGKLADPKEKLLAGSLLSTNLDGGTPYHDLVQGVFVGNVQRRTPTLVQISQKYDVLDFEFEREAKRIMSSYGTGSWVFRFPYDTSLYGEGGKVFINKIYPFQTFSIENTQDKKSKVVAIQD